MSRTTKEAAWYKWSGVQRCGLSHSVLTFASPPEVPWESSDFLVYKVGEITIFLVGLLGAFKVIMGLKLDLVQDLKFLLKRRVMYGETGIVPGEYDFVGIEVSILVNTW